MSQVQVVPRQLKILAVGKGLGLEKRKYFSANFPNLFILDLPEPSSEEFEKGKVTLEKKIAEQQPDFLIFCSRGAKYLSKLHKGYAILLISAVCV